jgi:hypothetical protein
MRALTTWTTDEITNFNGQLEKSMMARYLVHIIGDIHQPLHASSLFNKIFPNGDQGGNEFRIKFNSEIDNLHKLFDSCINRFKQIDKRPLSNEDSNYLEQVAKDIMKEYNNKNLPELSTDDYIDWVEESHDISQEFIYREININDRPTQEYLDKAFEYVKRRIALGGYRLAKLIEQIYDAYSSPHSDFQDDDEKNNVNKNEITFLMG